MNYDPLSRGRYHGRRFLRRMTGHYIKRWLLGALYLLLWAIALFLVTGCSV